MSGNQLYEFHQREIQDFRKAKERTLLVCRRLKSLTKDELTRDEPFNADWIITMLLDDKDSDKSCLEPVEHLLEEVAEPFDTPIIDRAFHSAGSSRMLRTAHRAVWDLRSGVCNCLWDIWGLHHRSAENESIIAASEGIVRFHWHELKERLEPLTVFEFDVLMQAVEAESTAAMARCRENIVGDATVTHKPSVDADISLVDSPADELEKACQEELKRALKAHKIRTEVAAKLTLEQRRNIIMAHWGCTSSNTRDKWLVSNWKPLLGKEGKTELANKVKVFIKRGKEKLAELAAEE